MEGTYPALRELTVELTRECYLNCSHCCMPSGIQRLPLSRDEILRLLDEASGLGLVGVRLTGGEPLAFPAFGAVLERAASLVHSVVVFTSGVYRNREQFVPIALSSHWPAMLRFPATELRISIESDSPDTHDSITGVPGSFELAVESIRTAKRQGFKTVIHHTPMSANLGSLSGIMNLVHELGADGIKILELFQVGRCRDELLLTLDEQRTLLQQLRDITENGTSSVVTLSEPFRLQLSEEARCEAGQDKLWVTNSGGLKYCAAARSTFASVRDASLAELWMHNEALEQLRSRNREVEGRVCFARESLEAGS